MGLDKPIWRYGVIALFTLSPPLLRILEHIFAHLLPDHRHAVNAVWTLFVIMAVLWLLYRNRTAIEQSVYSSLYLTLAFAFILPYFFVFPESALRGAQSWMYGPPLRTPYHWFIGFIAVGFCYFAFKQIFGLNLHTVINRDPGESAAPYVPLLLYAFFIAVPYGWTITMLLPFVLAVLWLVFFVVRHHLAKANLSPLWIVLGFKFTIGFIAGAAKEQLDIYTNPLQHPMNEYSPLLYNIGIDTFVFVHLLVGFIGTYLVLAAALGWDWLSVTRRVAP